MSPFSRRHFLKTSAIAAGALSAGSFLPDLAAQEKADGPLPPLRIDRPVPPAPQPIPAPAGFGVAPGPCKPAWESLAENFRVPDWYRDAKFGIWAHWGPQCQPGMGDWYAQTMYKPSHRNYKWHLEHYGHPSKFGFKDVINEWRAETWEPGKLVEFYKNAGARFFAGMANHHDNLDMWDSKYQPWNTARVGPKKDIIAGWARAAREAGLKFAVTCHGARAWGWYQEAQDADREGPLAGVAYDGRLTKAEGKGLWWEGLDPQDLYAQYHARGRYDRGAMLGDWLDPVYVEKYFNRTIDLIDQCDPDLLYFDDSVLPIYPRSDIGLRIAAYYYNRSIARHGGLETVLTGKNLDPDQRKAIVFDIENGVTDEILPTPWQTDICIGGWHYLRSLSESHGYKSSKQVVRLLIDIVSKNGNLMLSVPLPGSGALDADATAVVEGIGRWMAQNGECIYATRPWVIYGEGPSTAKTAVPKPKAFRSYTPEDFRFVTKGDTLIAFLMDWPGNGRAVIRSLATGSAHYPREIGRVELAGAGGPLPFTRDRDGLTVTLPAQKPNAFAYPLKITARS